MSLKQIRELIHRAQKRVEYLNPHGGYALVVTWGPTQVKVEDVLELGFPFLEVVGSPEVTVEPDRIAQILKRLGWWYWEAFDLTWDLYRHQGLAAQRARDRRDVRTFVAMCGQNEEKTQQSRDRFGTEIDKAITDLQERIDRCERRMERVQARLKRILHTAQFQEPNVELRFDKLDMDEIRRIKARMESTGLRKNSPSNASIKVVVG